MKKWLLFGGVLVLFGLSRLYYVLTDDFRMGNVLTTGSVVGQWESVEPSEEVRALLNQPYTYLGKGAQSFAFVSHDGKTVLKLFKTKHMKLAPWLHLIPFLDDYKEGKIPAKQAKMVSTLSGYRLAATYIPHQTGLLYLHLGPTTSLGTLKLHDKVGISHLFSLDNHVFVLQRRAKKWRQVVVDALKHGDVEKVKEHIVLLFALYEEEYQRGLYDSDHGVMHNVGFVDGQPIHFDIGKLKHDPQMKQLTVSQKDLEQVMSRMKSYLLRTHPEYADELLFFINERLESRS